MKQHEPETVEETPPYSNEYELELEIARFNAAALYEIERLIKSERITRKELGRRLGVHPSQVTTMLSDRGNLTLRSISRLMFALGHRPVLQSKSLESTPARCGHARHHRGIHCRIFDCPNYYRIFGEEPDNG